MKYELNAFLSKVLSMFSLDHFFMLKLDFLLNNLIES